MIIAINQDNKDLAGAIVYWRLVSEVNGDDLNNALTAVGLDDMHLRMPTPQKALRRAMLEHTAGEVFFRKHKGAHLLVRQDDGPDSAKFDIFVEAILNIAGQPKIRVFNADGTLNLESELQDSIEERYWFHAFHLSATDVSSWLTEQAALCDAVSLRDTGGVYFVPRHKINDWNKRVEVLHDHTPCTVHMIPALDSAESVTAIEEALAYECEQFSAQLQKDLDSENFGKRAMESKAQRAKEMLDKLQRFEALLGNSLNDVREKIEQQQADAMTAALVMEDK